MPDGSLPPPTPAPPPNPGLPTPGLATPTPGLLPPSQGLPPHPAEAAPAAGAPDGTGTPRVAAEFAAVLTQCRPELTGLVTGRAAGGAEWPERRWLMAEWAAVLESDTTPRHVLFAAGPGFGKTVAAAQFGLAAAGHGSAGDGAIVVGAFFRHGFTALEDPLGVVGYLSGQLARLLPGFSDAREASRMEAGAGNPVQVHVGDVSVTATQTTADVIGLQVTTPSGRPVDRAWRCDIADPLMALHRAGALPRVLIVADALDETSAPTRLMLADGLTLLPDPVRVLMTARPGTILPIGDPATNATVARLQPEGGRVPGVQPGSDDAAGPEQPTASPRRQDAELIAGWAAARLEAAGSDHAWAQQMGGRIAEAAERIFLVAAYLTDDLVHRLAAGDVPAAGDVDLPTGGLAGVYDSFLTRTFGEDTTKWRTLGRPVLGSLSVARGAGLTASIIAAASTLDLTDVTDTLADCAAFLTSEPASAGATVWRIWHRSFADHLHASATYLIRPWDWELRLGTALLPAALKATASRILDGDYRHQYATTNAVAHLVDAADDPEGVATESARPALATLADAGGWIEALVLLAGAGPAALQLERLGRSGPDSVPWRAAAGAIREQSHVLTAPLTLADGFTLGQLSVEAANNHDAELTAAVARWAQVTPTLLAAWSTAVSTGDVVTTHPGGITAMIATEFDGEQVCLIGGRDGWVRAWVPRTGQSVGTWRTPDQRRVTCLACVGEIAGAGADDPNPDAADSDHAAADGEGRTSVLVAVGTPTGTHALRWHSDGLVSVLWRAEDGPVSAALALDLGSLGPRGMSGDASESPGSTAVPAPHRLLLVTSHREELRARDLVTAAPAGHPPALPMPVIALATVAVPGASGEPLRHAVLAGCISDHGRSMVWDPRTDQTIGDLMIGGPVGCLLQAPGPTPGPLAVGLLGGTVKVGTLTAADGTCQFQSWAERDVGPTRKASSEAVTALEWGGGGGSELSLLVGDTAGRIHRLDPHTMVRNGPWTAGHPSSVTALSALAGDDRGGFVSAGFEGLVKSWQPADIDPARWPDQVLTLDVVAGPDAPATVVCAHATGEISELRMDTGHLIERRPVHESPVWALTWAGPDFGLVSGDSRGNVTCSQRVAGESADGRSGWRSRDLAQLSGRVSALSAGTLDGRTVVVASTLFSELVMLDQEGSTGTYPPFGGYPLTTALGVTAAGPCLVIEREVGAQHHAITGEPAGRQLHLISPLPQPGGDELRPAWRLWWEDPEMLGAWGCVWGAPGPDGGGRPPLLMAGLRDGAILTLDLDRVAADPNLGLDHYQVHESWPGRASVSTLAVRYLGDQLVTAWTTDDGWLFVEHSWQLPPLRLHLGSRVLMTRIAPDGTILLGGTDGVTAVRLR